MIDMRPDDPLPKTVWAVDENEHVYEAKRGGNQEYHGYELGDDDKAMKKLVIKEWNNRCPIS